MSKVGDSTARTLDGSEVRPSRASVGRFSLYLRRLEALLRDGTTRVSSSLLGEALGVTDAQVRKDLAYLGNLGQPGIGYDAPELVAALRRALALNREWPVALAGVGNLSRALLHHAGFRERGFRIVALFDVDPAKVGQQVEGLVIHSTAEMPGVIAGSKVELGVLAVPAEAAQEVADALIAAGIRGLLSFAPGVLRVPTGINVVSVDLTIQLEQLAFLVQVGGSD